MVWPWLFFAIFRYVRYDVLDCQWNQTKRRGKTLFSDNVSTFFFQETPHGKNDIRLTGFFWRWSDPIKFPDKALILKCAQCSTVKKSINALFQEKNPFISMLCFGRANCVKKGAFYSHIEIYFPEMSILPRSVFIVPSVWILEQPREYIQNIQVVFTIVL